ncbi:MAG TPA: porin family protein [Chitinophagaceae bacterium]|nr:porin family protein [Chitinophagaceae bacterium]
MKSQSDVMKKSALMLIAAVFATVSVVSAQEQQSAVESSISPKFGVKGGVNLSNLYVDQVDDENMKLGLNLGLFAKIPLTRGLSIQPELLYSSKGAKLNYNNILLGRGEYRFNLNYVDLPVLAIINVARNINLQAGGYVSYLASANIKDLESDGTINNIKELEADDFNRFDYGLVGGVGIDVQHFTLGVRYNYGLKEVGEAGSLSGRLTQNSKNSVISIYAGIGF